MQKCYEWPTLGWQLWCEQMFGGLCLITWLHISQSQQNILQHSQHWHSHTLCLISISNHNYEECRMNVEYLQSTLCIQIMHLLQIAKLTTELLLSISLTISSIIQCSLYNFQFNLTWLYSVIFVMCIEVDVYVTLVNIIHIHLISLLWTVRGIFFGKNDQMIN